MQIKTYNEAKELFENTRKRKLANNTYLVKTANGYGVKLYNTVVVEYLDANRIRLNTGGWYTVTTFQRIRSHIPFAFRELGFDSQRDMPNSIVVDTRDDYPNEARRA